MPDPLSIARPATAELIERKSRFVAHLHPAASVAEAEAVIAELRAAHPSARHHCTAMIIGPDQPLHRSNDDGEPSGTAGMPILQALLAASLVDVVAVVVRWFGGIKLGTGPLGRAYGRVTTEAIGAARLVVRRELLVATLAVPHAEAGLAENALHTWAAATGATVQPTEYGPTGATLSVLVAPEQLDALRGDVASWSAGRFEVRQSGTRVVAMPASRTM